MLRFRMLISRSGLATVVVALVVSACGAQTVSPSASPSAIPIGASETPSLEPSRAPASSTALVSRDLALYALPQANDLMRGAAIASLTSGPAGVVILGNDRATGALMSWTSPDGDHWVRHWLPGTTFGGGTPDRLVGGPFGYLTLGWKTDPAARAMVEGLTFPRALWSSSDGVDWTPAPEVGLPVGDISALVSGPVGVAAIIPTLDDHRATVAVTQDGRRWHQATLPTDAIPNWDGLVALPDGFLLRGSTEATDAAGGMVATDAAWRSGDGISWTPAPELAKQLRERENSIDNWQLSPWGAVGSSFGVGLGAALVTPAGLHEVPAVDTGSWAGQVVAGPAGLLWVLGADRSASCVSAWRYVDDGWRPLQGPQPDMTCLNAAGPTILGSAAMPDGMVIIGMLGAESDRVAWLVRDPGNPPTGTVAGGAMATPPAEAIPDPLAVKIEHPAGCPSLPTTIAVILDLAPGTAAGCFGDQSITFRAWVVDPGEGYGGTCVAFTPAWIRECVLPDYLLTVGPPAAAVDVPTLHAMRSPKAKGDLVGVGRWVKVQGHYDDPVSPSCRAAGEVGMIGLEPEPPNAMVVSACRLVFVVTDIRTVR